MQAMYPLVSVIIQTHNKRDQLIRCLKSVRQTNYPNFEVIVIASACRDDSVQVVRLEFPEVKVIDHPRDEGVSGGNNIGIMASSGKYLSFLNDDCVVDSNWIRELVEVMESDESIGVTACKAYFPNSDVIQYAGGFLDDRGYPIMIGIGESDHGQYDRICDVDWAGGGVYTVRRDLIDLIGLMDTNYFMHYFDTEFCLRARMAGSRVVYVPMSKVWHHGGGGKKTKRKIVLMNSKNRIRLVLEYFNDKQVSKMILSELFATNPRRLFCSVTGLIWNSRLLLKRIVEKK